MEPSIATLEVGIYPYSEYRSHSKGLPSSQDFTRSVQLKSLFMPRCRNEDDPGLIPESAVSPGSRALLCVTYLPLEMRRGSTVALRTSVCRRKRGPRLSRGSLAMRSTAKAWTEEREAREAREPPSTTPSKAGPTGPREAPSSPFTSSDRMRSSSIIALFKRAIPLPDELKLAKLVHLFRAADVVFSWEREVLHTGK